ncbi:hypothetical protein B0H12DRAFT_576556 [Mycena haematopus]|nr:hypothetical protein B0H12DRAFT_576556 [Mycena haematopus]
MPIFKCRQCPTREFNSRVALLQHFRQSTPSQHPFCVQCDKYCSTQEGLDTHNRIHHPPFECTTCHSTFQSQSSLEDHYRGKASSIHPNCLRCGKGFFNASAVDEHFKNAHPLAQCLCGHKIFEEDLPAHYTESMHHPTCVQCATGFKDDAAYNAHNIAEHPECRCTPCLRQFNSKTELQDHFDASDLHPKCLKCGTVGFFNDAALNEHLAERHLLSPPMGAALGPQFKDFLAIEAPPATSPRTTLPLPGKEINTAWKSNKNQVVPPSIGPWQSTALMHRGELPTAGGRGTEPPPRIFQLANAATGQNLVPRPQITCHSLSETATERSESYKSFKLLNGTDTSTAMVVSSEQSAKTISPQSSKSSFSSFVGPAGGSYGTTSGTIRPITSMGNLNQIAASKESVIIPEACVRCMYCKGRCIDPTATMCGHVFCKNCITKRVQEVSECPKCAAPTLLYCLFRLHLEG